jgi:hypothetical protein
VRARFYKRRGGRRFRTRIARKLNGVFHNHRKSGISDEDDSRHYSDLYQALLRCTAAAASRLLMLYWYCDLVPCDRSSKHPSSSTPRVTLLCILTNPSTRGQLGVICTASLPETSTLSPEVDTILWTRTSDPSLFMADATNRRVLGWHFH